MKAYDLDGVLISDLHWDKSTPIEHFLEMRSRIPLANFVPSGDYYIVTGRSASDRKYTESWIEKNLASNPPKKLFHDCPDYRLGAEYKAKIINENSILTFIESDMEQVLYLRQHCPNCKIYHFGSLISDNLLNL